MEKEDGETEAEVEKAKGLSFRLRSVTRIYIPFLRGKQDKYAVKTSKSKC